MYVRRVDYLDSDCCSSSTGTRTRRPPGGTSVSGSTSAPSPVAADASRAATRDVKEKFVKRSGPVSTPPQTVSSQDRGTEKREKRAQRSKKTRTEHIQDSKHLWPLGEHLAVNYEKDRHGLRPPIDGIRTRHPAPTQQIERTIRRRKKGTDRCRPQPWPRSRPLAPQGGGGRARWRVAAHRRPRTPFSCLLSGRAAPRSAVGAIAIVVVIMGRMPWRGASRLDRRCGGDVTIWVGLLGRSGGGGDADAGNGQ